MGKRELLLIVGFLIAGVIVYQATAPAPKPGEEGVSISRILANMRRAIHGNSARADVVHSTSYPVSPAATELRLSGSFAAVAVTGEDRPDIAAELTVNSAGYDEAEARSSADRTVVKLDAAGTTANLHVEYPPEGRQTAALTLKVPSRLRVRVEQTGPRTAIANVAAAEIVSSRGETTVKQIAGRVALSHRGGRVVVEDAGSLKLAARSGGEARVTRVGGDASFDFQGGELEAGDIAGPIDIDARSADLTLHADRARGPIRINAVGGSVVLDNVRSDVRIDGRNTEVTVSISDGAPSVAIYDDGGEDIRVTPPPGGYQLDAITREGHITVPQNTVTVATSGNEQRASGTVKAGGPVITLRASRGDIIVRAR